MLGTDGAIAQSDGTVDYPNWFFAEGEDPPPNECPGYDTKQSDGEIPVMLELWRNAEYLCIAITPRSTLARSCSSS